ncbi:MAG: hypothetical protein ACRDLS_01070 [Solirubrobacteraceae bacterium]
MSIGATIDRARIAELTERESARRNERTSAPARMYDRACSRS